MKYSTDNSKLLLGPRLFSMYVDDFPEALGKGQLEMYADDTIAYCVASTINEICEDLQTMLSDIHQWCAKNRLTIRPEKTKSAILKRHKAIGPLNELNLGEQMIEYVHTSECLGVLIDSKLTWRPQFKSIRKWFGAK